MSVGLEFLSGGGEMGERIRARDWQASLGSPRDWPASLKTLVGVMLASHQPKFIIWGPSRIWLNNDPFIPILGLKHPQALGRPAMEVWEEARSVLKPLFDRVFSGEAIHMAALCVPLDRNGELEEAHFAFAYTPVRDESGHVVGLFGNCIETTAQVRATQELEQSERRLQLALEGGTGIGTWDWDLKTNRVIADARFARLYGVDPAQAKSGAPVAEFFKAIHPDDLGRVENAIADFLKLGGTFREEYRLPQPDGSVRWVIAQGNCSIASDGTPTRFSGASFDITASKQTELLRQAQVRVGDAIRDLESPADLAFEAAKILGETLNVSRVGYGSIDQRAETITIERDWNAPGIKSLAGVLHFRDYGSYIEDLKRGETVVFENAETDPRTFDNGAALKAISAQSLVNMPVAEQGDFVALLYLNHATARAWPDEELAFIRDIAHRIRTAVGRLDAERELRTIAASLESQVQRRTEQVLQAEEALRQTQKMEAVGQLTGGIAHDFNNMLAGIIGGLDLIQSRLAQGRLDGIQRYIDGAQDSARRAASLTQRLLAFSRRQTLTPRPVLLNRLVTGMEALIRHSVSEKIKLDFELDEGVWATLVDPSQLENALLNLCINARDAMPDGGTITIGTSNHSLDDRAAAGHNLPPGEYISLRVTDTGTGMSPEVLARAFDPFFTTKPLGQGTGLGLSMIHGFANQSHGQIRITTEFGKGTTVCLYLPRFVGEILAPDESAGDRRSLPMAQGETVLVVDDEAVIRMLVAEVLGDAGFNCIETVDGESALKILNTNRRIDLLITDVGLPGTLNGRQVADAARALRKNIQVLFITGYAEKVVMENGNLEPGMQILSKPFSTTLLARKVKDMLAR